MQLFTCKACFNERSIKKYGKCYLLNKTSDFDPLFCPYDSNAKPKWVNEQYSFKVAKRKNRTTAIKNKC
ncbi:MAG: hypothetical protein PHF86_03190 [Candidatus Nanoarchaeia archaeon]|jgi:hypothetical protein|nr:hypothetical protein [Candidatus Nanoarchaeia archaeon]